METLQFTKVVTAQEMRGLDAMATERYGVPSIMLMENAGRAVFEAAVDMLGDAREKRVVVVCGPGNNGGDGFVAARHLYNAGAFVTIAYYGDRAKARGDALVNMEIAEKMGLDIQHNQLDDDFWSIWQRESDIIIDALLGTGIKGELREPYAGVISRINGCISPVLSVDIPSGVDADTGVLLGKAVEADTTVTFALPKIGLLTYPGAEHCGSLRIVDISIPADALNNTDSRVFMLDGEIAHTGLAAKRYPDSNKGNFGHVLVVAGSVGMTGAATLAAEGALRTGAGLVTVAAPQSLNDILEVKLTEAMTIPVPEGKARAFGMASLDKVLDIIDRMDVVVVGPGFGRDDDTIAFTLELIRKLNKPAIIDADALYALSTDLSPLKECNVPVIITPHPGEMARLTGTTAGEVQSKRLEAARQFAGEHNVIVVLKGAGTVIAEPDGAAYINTTGTPGMATGGTGDVLSGMVGARLAVNTNYALAACEAVYLHGLAGRIAAEIRGEAAMIASDVAEFIGDALQEVIKTA